MTETTLTYTDAPTDYDGFRTHTIRIVGKLCGKEVRLVETPTEHVNWQRARYASGMYLSANQDEWEKLAVMAVMLGHDGIK